MTGDQVGFFLSAKTSESLASKKFEGGSLTSTYRVVNTTLRAESEKTGRPRIFWGRTGEFQLSNLIPHSRDLQIDQATKSTSMDALVPIGDEGRDKLR